MSKRAPNILFLQTDHQRHDTLGCVQSVVKTPNLDKLAARGTRYSQAVCNVPMCVPSRYSMMTGLYGSQLGVRHNRQIIAKDEELPPVLAQHLQSAGYQTAGFGKTHWYLSPHHGIPNQTGGSTRGFEIRALARHYYSTQNEGSPEEVTYFGEEATDIFDGVQEEKKRGGPGGETSAGYLGDTSAYPSEQQKEGWLTDKALAFLDQDRDPERPWFCYLSFDAPHPGFFVPKGFEEMYNIEDIEDVPELDALPEGHREGWRESEWAELTPYERRLARLRFYALTSYVDYEFGRVLEKLEEIGEADNTVIIMTSDHGDMLGERGRITKYCLYDGSVRVPLILAGPGIPENTVDNRPAELIDILPTLLETAGSDVPVNLPGNSLLSNVRRAGSFAELHGQGYEEIQQAPSYMWRTEDWKLILYLPGELRDAVGRLDDTRGELYNLREDPWEMNNLYEAPDHLKKREEMTRQLLMHLACAWARHPFMDTPVTIE